MQPSLQLLIKLYFLTPMLLL